MSSTKTFETLPPLKLFFIVAIPGAISMLASSLYSVIDLALVGRFIGQLGFAAVTLVMPLVVINFSLADLIGVGSSVPISICLGKKQEGEANNIFTCSCLIILVIGAITGTIIYFASPFIVSIMGATGALADMAVQYVRVFAICSPVMTIMFAMDNYLRICNKIRFSTGLNIFMALLSATIEIIFLGVLKLDIWAAAFATCLGTITCVLIGFTPFFRGKLQLHFCKPKFSVPMVKQIIACGTPNFLNNISGRIVTALMNVLLLRIGGAIAVSVYGILMSIEMMVSSLLYGLCDSLQPAVGYNWGAGKYNRVTSLEKCCFGAGAFISVFMAIIIFCFPQQLTLIFMKDVGRDLLEMAIPAVKLFSLTFLVRWISYATQSFLLAIEKTKPASILSVSTAFIFPLIMLVVLYPIGMNGFWLNMAGTSTLTGIMSAVFLIRLRREIKKI